MTTPADAFTAVGLPAAWFDTAGRLRADTRVDELVADAARRYGDRPALVTDDGSVLNHAQLDRWANGVAHQLRDWGVGRGDKVAVIGDHAPRIVASLVGILRCGAAYVPLDPAWPAARIAALCADLAVRVVVTDAARLPTVLGLPDLRHVMCVGVDHSPAERGLERDAVVELWNTVAGDADPVRAAGFNFADDASAADEQITRADAARYVEHVAELVGPLLGEQRRLLDVGCGAGLVTAALLPMCRRYLGVDPSPVAVRRLSTGYAGAPGADFRVGFAHQLDEVDETFDVALLASTVQFFPDRDYLTWVLGEIAGRLRPGGAMVVADVIDPAAETHAGLALPPEFFTTLVDTSPLFAEAQLLSRPAGRFTGTLAGRYDVVLRTTGRRQPADELVVGWRDVLARPDAPPAVPDLSADDLAYVIFTSGSTGRPKGVAVRHRSVVNLIDWVADTYQVGPDDRLLFTTSFAFDLSVYDMFGLLAAGGSIHLVSDDVRAEPSHLARLLAGGTITFWDSAPAALSAVLPFVTETAQPAEKSPRHALRLVFVSGDWVPLTMPDALHARFPAATLVALGGATECTVWSNHFRVDRVEEDWASIPYGRPIRNCRYYILRPDGSPAPVDEPGALFIAGECVAIGYLGDPELTSRKFVTDPWWGGTMYDTGDRARWRPDGTIEFLGRLDDQVKIRGYRVELGEVRAALIALPGVRDAAVIAPDGADGRTLAAFYTASESGPDPDAVRAALAERLPRYLVPQQLRRMTVLPVGPTGKVDLRLLSALPEPSDRQTDQPAASPTLRLVHDCWRQVFGAAPGSDTLSFLRTGGSSLSAARLAAALRAHGHRVTVRQVLAHPTPAALTALLTASAGTT